MNLGWQAPSYNTINCCGDAATAPRDQTPNHSCCGAVQIPVLLTAAAAVMDLQHPGLATGGLFWQDLHAPPVNVVSMLEYLQAVRANTALTNDECEVLRATIAPGGPLACVLAAALFATVNGNVRRSAAAAAHFVAEWLGQGGPQLRWRTLQIQVRFSCDPAGLWWHSSWSALLQRCQVPVYVYSLVSVVALGCQAASASGTSALCVWSCTIGRNVARFAAALSTNKTIWVSIWMVCLCRKGAPSRCFFFFQACYRCRKAWPSSSWPPVPQQGLQTGSCPCARLAQSRQVLTTRLLSAHSRTSRTWQTCKGSQLQWRRSELANAAQVKCLMACWTTASSTAITSTHVRRCPAQSPICCMTCCAGY